MKIRAKAMHGWGARPRWTQTLYALAAFLTAVAALTTALDSCSSS